MYCIYSRRVSSSLVYMYAAKKVQRRFSRQRDSKLEYIGVCVGEHEQSIYSCAIVERSEVCAWIGNYSFWKRTICLDVKCESLCLLILKRRLSSWLNSHANRYLLAYWNALNETRWYLYIIWIYRNGILICGHNNLNTLVEIKRGKYWGEICIVYMPEIIIR